MRNDTKIYIFSLVILVIIIISGIYINAYLDKTANMLLKEISSVEIQVNNGNWQDAGKNISNISMKWDSIKKSWSLITNHHEIDNISITLKNSSSFIKSKEKADSLASISSLKHYISHIPKMEKMFFENIF